MKLTKKQWIVGGVLALVLGGVSAGVVANNQAQAQAEKIAQEAKTATEKAETFKAEADVKTAQEAIKKLDEKDKTGFSVRVEKVQLNWELVNKADKAVTNAEKVQNDANVKTAQATIDKIKDGMAKSKKMALQVRLDKVKTTVKAKKDKAEADKKAKEKAAQEAQAKQEEARAQNNTQASVEDTTNNTPTPAGQEAPGVGTGNTDSVDNGSVAGGNPTSSAPANPAPSTPQPSTPSPSTPTPSEPTPTPPAPPATVYHTWVRDGSGKIVAQKDFTSAAEGATWAVALCNQHPFDNWTWGQSM